MQLPIFSTKVPPHKRKLASKSDVDVTCPFEDGTTSRMTILAPSRFLGPNGGTFIDFNCIVPVGVVGEIVEMDGSSIPVEIGASCDWSYDIGCQR